MRFTICLESNERGDSLAHVLEHPGCQAMGRRQEVLERMPRQIAGFRGWLRLHGQALPRIPAAGYEIEIVEEQAADPRLFESGSRLSLFEADRRPLSDAALEARLNVAGRSRRDLLSMTRRLPPATLRREREGRSVEQILRHVAYVEFWYAWAVHREWPEPEGEPESVWELLDFARREAFSGLRSLPPGRRGRIYHRPPEATNAEERWTHGKAVRRLLEHHLEHAAEVWRILDGWDLGPLPYVPSPWGVTHPAGSSTVRLRSSDPRWPEAFARQRETLQRMLGPTAERIEHVGSTAVPGLAAKPIVDILVGLRWLDAGAERIPALLAEGYSYVPEYEAELPERLYLRRGTPRTVHLHKVETRSPEWERMIRFRDHLRAKPGAARRYERLKRELAERHADDREAYTQGKSEFIESVLRETTAG